MKNIKCKKCNEINKIESLKHYSFYCTKCNYYQNKPLPLMQNQTYYIDDSDLNKK